jgi:NAD(P)-dependent dehydrogenase (short-subunit alcohol dehydrogenase family)
LNFISGERMHDLAGKVALVTGGARGIGREISLLLAQAGAEVVVNFNKSKDQAESLLQEIVQQGRKAEVFADIASRCGLDYLNAFRRNFRLDIPVTMLE